MSNRKPFDFINDGENAFTQLKDGIDQEATKFIDLVDNKVSEMRGVLRGVDHGTHVVIQPEEVASRMERLKEAGTRFLAKPVTPLGFAFLTGSVGGAVGAAAAGPVGVGLVMLGMGISTINDLVSLGSLHLRLKEQCPETYAALDADFAMKNAHKLKFMP